MDFKSELLGINQKLAARGVKLRIEKRGNKLNLRGPLPCQNDPKQIKNQRISLGLNTNTEGLKQAEKTVNFLFLQIEHNQFDWENWSHKKTQSTNKENQTDINNLIKDFKLFFFNDPAKSKSKAGICLLQKP